VSAGATLQRSSVGFGEPKYVAGVMAQHSRAVFDTVLGSETLEGSVNASLEARQLAGMRMIAQSVDSGTLRSVQV